MVEGHASGVLQVYALIRARASPMAPLLSDLRNAVSRTDGY